MTAKFSSLKKWATKTLASGLLVSYTYVLVSQILIERIPISGLPGLPAYNFTCFLYSQLSPRTIPLGDHTDSLSSQPCGGSGLCGLGPLDIATVGLMRIYLFFTGRTM